MVITTYAFKNYVLKIQPAKNDKTTAILILHGFPSESFNDTPLEKNKDLGLFLSQSLNLNTYIPHYKGLGKSRYGQFSFQESIKESLELTDHLLTQYKNLILIGHSWGGLVALMILHCRCEYIKEILLLSPMSRIPSRSDLEKIFENIIKSFPYILKLTTQEDLINDLIHVKEKYNLSTIISALNSNTKVSIIQARQDEEVLYEDTYKLYKLFNKKATLEVIDSDHGFIRNRSQLFQKCLESLKT